MQLFVTEFFVVVSWVCFAELTYCVGRDVFLSRFHFFFFLLFFFFPPKNPSTAGRHKMTS